MFNVPVFKIQKEVPVDAKIVFVADMYISDYVGGAELTTEALIDESPHKVFKLRSNEITHELVINNTDKFWIFGNFTQLNPQLFPLIVGNLKYAILEYDFKYCAFRSPEKHMFDRGMPCDCHNQMHGKMISAFFYGAKILFWMSEKQKDRYFTMFPFISERDNIVLSSVFNKETLGKITLLREKMKNEERTGWIVLGSSSWIKGADSAEKWCKDNGKKYEVVWNLEYTQMLAKMASAEGVVYLPKGGDTCPRLTIEAKLLGCNLKLNDGVLHKDEEWFATDDLQAIHDYLYAAPGLFWNSVTNALNYTPSISGYVTTYNCITQEYPFKQCIQSMLTFCDEVVVVDGKSDDGTLEELHKLELQDPRIKVDVIARDWSAPRASLFDGMQKAHARKLCTKEFCWQMDADEVVHEDDAQKIVDLCRKMPKNIDIISLPVIEYWGSTDKVRCDINLAKWRLSRNKPNITHGVPVDLQAFDETGAMYAKPGTDGCCMIDVVTNERLQHVTFITPEIEQARQAAVGGNIQALQAIEQWFKELIVNVPSVHHYSWIDFKRKMKLYRDTWQKHWLSLYNMKIDDTAENNMFFDKPWSEVTEEMMDEKAKELSMTGGHIFHRKFNLNNRTPWITLARKQPKFMEQK